MKKFIMYFNKVGNIFPNPNQACLINVNPIYDIMLRLEEERSSNRAIHSPINPRNRNPNYGSGIDMDSWVLTKSQMEIYASVDFMNGIVLKPREIKPKKDSYKFMFKFDLNDIYELPIDIADEYKYVWFDEDEIICVEPFIAEYDEKHNITKEKLPQKEYFSFYSNTKNAFLNYKKVSSLKEINDFVNGDLTLTIENLCTKGYKDTGIIFFQPDMEKRILEFIDFKNPKPKTDTLSNNVMFSNLNSSGLVMNPYTSTNTFTQSDDIINKTIDINKILDSQPIDLQNEDVKKMLIDGDIVYEKYMAFGAEKVEMLLYELHGMVSMPDYEKLKASPLGIIIMNVFKSTLRYTIPITNLHTISDEEITNYVDLIFGEIVDKLPMIEIDGKITYKGMHGEEITHENLDFELIDLQLMSDEENDEENDNNKKDEKQN